MHKQLKTLAYHKHFPQIPQFSTQREGEGEKCVMEVGGNPNSNLISLLFKKNPLPRHCSLSQFHHWSTLPRHYSVNSV